MDVEPGLAGRENAGIAIAATWRGERDRADSGYSSFISLWRIADRCVPMRAQMGCGEGRVAPVVDRTVDCEHISKVFVGERITDSIPLGIVRASS